MEEHEEVISQRTLLFERCYELGLTIDIKWGEQSSIKILEGNTVLNIEHGDLDECIERTHKYLDEL
jgi:hypothetical protein